MLDWISVQDKMPSKVGMVKVKIDDGSVYDGFVCRTLSQSLVIIPWMELVTHWKEIY